MRRSLLFTMLVCAVIPSVWARFQTTPHELIKAGAFNKKSGFSMALEANSLVPFSSPFSTNNGSTSQNFRYAIPWVLGLELSYHLLKNLELGFSVGYENYQARNNYSTDPTKPTLHIIKGRTIPIHLLGRYLIYYPRWRLEFEGGLGTTLGSLQASTTDSAVPQEVDVSISFRGYGAVGAGFPWSDKFSSHLQIGYGFQSIEAKTIALGQNLVTDSTSGIFLKGQMRYHF